MRLTRCTVSIVALACLCLRIPLLAADLKPVTVEAFGRYVQAAEARMDDEVRSGQPFLWVDSLPSSQKAAAYDRLRKGEVLVQSRAAGLDIPGGMIHDWVGITFIPNVTLDQALALIEDYDRDCRFYAPAVVRSKILERDGDHFTVFLRLQKRSFATEVFDVLNDVQHSRLDARRAYSRSHSTRVVEIENAGTPREREKPPGQGHGYLWKLNDYSRYLEANGGVYLQFEFIALSRSIPWGFGWMIKPFVKSIPRESLDFTLLRTRDSIQNGIPQAATVGNCTP